MTSNTSRGARAATTSSAIGRALSAPNFHVIIEEHSVYTPQFDGLPGVFAFQVKVILANGLVVKMVVIRYVLYSFVKEKISRRSAL